MFQNITFLIRHTVFYMGKHVFRVLVFETLYKLYKHTDITDIR